MCNIEIFCSHGKKLLAALCLLPCALLSQLNTIAALEGARMFSLAGSFPGAVADPWMVLKNAAALSGSERLTASATFSPSRFGLPELGSAGAGVSWCGESGGAGFVLGRMGGRVFSTSMIAIGGNVAATPAVRIGAVATLCEMRFERYGAARFWMMSASSTIDVSDQIQSAVCVGDVLRSWIVRGSERTPMQMTFSTSLRAATGIRLSAEVAGEAGADPVVRVGGEATVLGALSLRCGLSTDPDVFAAGFGVTVRSIHAAYGFQRHPELGETHVLEVGVSLMGVGEK